MGLPNLYTFYRDTGKFDEPAALAAAMEGVGDVTPIIVDAAIREPENNPICAAVVDLFISILAAQAGNLALTVSCYGGVYIGGGIPPRITKFINKRQFVADFQDKGRLAPMMSNIPIYLIHQPDIALIGAACHGLYL
jgi:glucokinase